MIPVGAHWGQRAYAQAEAAGLSFVFAHPHYFAGGPWDDEAGDTRALLDTNLRIVLFWEFHNEAHLTRRSVWREWVEQCWEWLQPHRHRILGHQFGDEAQERFWHNRASDMFPKGEWPHIGDPRLMGSAPWNDRRHFQRALMSCWAERSADVTDVFGPSPLGWGQSVAGSVQVEPFAGQAWWGLDLYLGPAYNRRAVDIWDRYAAAAATGLQLMPVLHLGSEPANPLQPLGEIERAYLPMLYGYKRQICAVGLFPWRHPAQWDVRHPEPRELHKGIADMNDPQVLAAVRWLAAEYGR